MLGQVVISGILSGALYAMVALGLALIFGVMRIINVALGPLLLPGAYTTYFLSTALGINPYLTVPVSMAMLFVVGVLLERTLVFRVVDAPELSSLLLTFGVSIALVNLAQLLFTSDLRSVEYLTGAWVVGPFALSKTRVVAFVFAGTLTGLAFLFLGWTKLGKAIRATSQSREVAMVCGIDVQRIHLVTFGLASALAAAGGALIAVIVAIQPEMGQTWTFKSFLVIVLGGAGRRERPARGLRGARGRRARARRVPRRRERLRGPRDPASLHVDRAGRLLEPYLGTHGLRLVRPRGVLRRRRLRWGDRNEQGRLALARRGARGRGRRRRPRAGHRLPVPAPEGPILRHRDARAQRGPASARVVLRRSHRWRERAVATDAGRYDPDLLRHGAHRGHRDRAHLPHHHVALRAAADDDPGGRGRRRSDGDRHRPAQALRLPPLRGGAGHRRRAHRARPGLHRADQRLSAGDDDHDDRHGALRRQGHRVGTGAGRGRALRHPGGRLGALSLRPPAPLRRDHRRRGAAHAARRARHPPDQVPAAPDHLT